MPTTIEAVAALIALLKISTTHDLLLGEVVWQEDREGRWRNGILGGGRRLGRSGSTS
jgi:hypothetical protein